MRHESQPLPPGGIGIFRGALIVFAPLVLLAQVADVTSTIVGTAAMVYFWARVVHAVAYTFAVPWIRTLSFAVGFFAQAAVARSLLIR